MSSSAIDREAEEIASVGPFWLVALLAVGLLTARLMSAGYGSFTENDSISIAAGVAALRNESIGDLYRYGPQVGYYHLVSVLSRLTGSNLLHIPVVMITLSVVSATVIPLMGLGAFRRDLSRTERWLVAATLAASPVLWMSSRYGNSALPSVALAVAALVILSNAPAARWEMAALTLFGAAILVRADAVLATPGIGVLLWRNRGSLRAAVTRVALLGLGVAALYGFFFVLDRRVLGIVGAVRSHMVNEFGTMFWEYLLWSLSPFPFLFAASGAREMIPARRWLLGFIAAWTLPLFLFYYTATTTPRYFLLAIFPLAIATAVGMTGIVRLAGARRTVAWAAVLALGFVHLFVGLGHFVPGRRRSMLKEASFPTHVGPMWTGAFLYKSYVQNAADVGRVLHPRFGAGTAAEQTLSTAFGELAAGGRRGSHVVLVTESGYGNVMHFYAHVAGARILSRGAGPLFNGEFEMELGGTRLTTIGIPLLAADREKRFPVAVGDEVWVVQRDSVSSPLVAGRMPAGLALGAPIAMPNAPRLARYRVESAI